MRRILKGLFANYKAAAQLNNKQIPFEHAIDLTDDIPVSQQPRRLPFSLKEPVKQQLNILERDGIITSSDTKYRAPIIPVIKKNGGIRIAIDYRSLNKKTLPKRFPIPHPDDLIEKVKKSSIFSVIDLKQGYYHIPTKEDDRHKTAFVVPWAKYECNRLPQGLVGAPFTFGETMNYLLKDFDFVVCFYDDLLIHSKTKEEHFRHVQLILERLSEYGLEVNEDKTQFFKSEVLFLGHIVSGTGIKIDAKKIYKNIDELRKFLGVTGFLRKFLRHYSMIAAPLYD